MTERFSTWHGHFAVMQSDRLAIAGWRKTQIFNWTVLSHPLLPVVSVYNNEHSLAGVILGWAVDKNGTLLSHNDSIQLPLHNDASMDNPASLAMVYGLTGRWLYISLLPNEERIYLDPCGSQPLVYSKEDGIVASVPALIPSATDSAMDNDLVKLFNIPHKDRYLPFGYTPWRHIKRLLPNHFLCLSTWSAVRHYPGPPLQDISLETAAANIVESTQHTAAAFAAVAPLYASLTAGRDSRMILACLRPMLEQVRLFTRVGFSGSAGIDIAVARLLTKRLGITLEIVERATASASELNDWQERTGHSLAGAVWKCARMDETAGDTLSLTPGMCGELGRSFERDLQWKPGDTRDVELSPELIISRLNGMPHHPFTVHAARQWLASCPTKDFLKILDLLFIELRLGCWGSAQVYGARRESPTVYLLNSRKSIDAMLALPEPYKRSGDLHNAIIKEQWPELLDYPYNRWIGPAPYEAARSFITSALPGRLLIYAQKLERRLWARFLIKDSMR